MCPPVKVYEGLVKNAGHFLETLRLTHVPFVVRLERSAERVLLRDIISVDITGDLTRNMIFMV